jgi:hypothetical protein
MYFPDLSEYAYGHAPPQRHILNVGWLSKDHPHHQGVVPAELSMRLSEIVRSPVNLYRGSHMCEFCPEPPTIMSPGGIKMVNPPPGTLGNGEVRIRARNGTVYVAPVLIYHYVAVHGYLPPGEFIEAVKTGSVLDGSEPQ